MKIAVVTGASSGLGKEFVFEIAKHFSKVEEIWVIARRTDRLEELKKLVHNKKIVVIPLDLALNESYEIYKKLLDKHKPRIKILVNCAGYGKVINFDKGVYNEQIGMIDVNCKALVSITKLSIPYMYSTSYIINLASSAAFIPLPKLAVYSATKSLVLSFSRALNRELKSKGIKVTAVCPGPVSTEFLDIAQQLENYKVFQKTPAAKPDKVVRAAMKSAMRGKELSIYGLIFKPLVVMAKVVPHGLFLRLFK